MYSKKFNSRNDAMHLIASNPKIFMDGHFRDEQLDLNRNKSARIPDVRTDHYTGS